MAKSVDADAKAAKKAARKQREQDEAAALIAAGSGVRGSKANAIKDKPWMNGKSTTARKRAFSAADQSAEPNKKKSKADGNTATSSANRKHDPVPDTASKTTVEAAIAVVPKPRRRIVEHDSDDRGKAQDQAPTGYTSDSDDPAAYEERLRQAKAFRKRRKGQISPSMEQVVEDNNQGNDNEEEDDDGEDDDGDDNDDGDDDDDDDDDDNDNDNDNDDSSSKAGSGDSNPIDGEDEDNDLTGQGATQLRGTLAREQVPAWTSPEPHTREDDNVLSDGDSRIPPRRRVASTASSDYELPPPSTDAATSEFDDFDHDDSDAPQGITSSQGQAAPSRGSAPSRSRPEHMLFEDDNDVVNNNVKAPKKSNVKKKSEKKAKKPGKREMKRRLEEPRFNDTDDRRPDAGQPDPERKPPTNPTWPPWTNLARNSRNGVNLLSQEPQMRAVLRATNASMYRRCGLVHAYPEVDDKLDHILTTLRKHATAMAPEVADRMTADRRYCELLATVPANAVSQYRSKIATKSPAVIAQAYGLEGLTSGVIVKRVEDLLIEHAYLFKLKPGNEVTPILAEPLGHPILVTLMKATLFHTRSHPGNKLLSEFPVVNGKPEIPIPMLALIATVIEFGLMAWSSGTHHPTQFTAEATSMVYEGVLEYIKYLKSGLTAPQYHRLLADILQRCRTSSKISTALSSTVVASHKVDFASMPQ
ncbi:hypothetical protein EUX98_g9278 [Antrodiella citrinella]|uniref:DUF6532 domain-containing protein n=1 Tax=Antrodiella citrinella TaxID=2447956 RepID=A0A4S4LVT5_9APHY|nr:hypothetical protein EUX98_g9278 [Antrodiella citrinella]